jgi:hypothetical protein
MPTQGEILLKMAHAEVRGIRFIPDLP